MKYKSTCPYCETSEMVDEQYNGYTCTCGNCGQDYKINLKVIGCGTKRTSDVLKTTLMVLIPVVLVICAVVVYLAKCTRALDNVHIPAAFVYVDTSKPDDVLAAKAVEAVGDERYDLAMKYANAIRNEADRIIVVTSVKQAKKIYDRISDAERSASAAEALSREDGLKAKRAVWGIREESIPQLGN